MVRIYIIKKVPIIYSNASPTPVSYTHLDVYKRQALVCSHMAVCFTPRFVHFKILKGLLIVTEDKLQYYSYAYV